MPTIFAAQPVAEEGRWAFGIGQTSLYGRFTALDQDSIFRYAAPYYTQLISVELAPIFATRIHERVSFSFSVNLLWSELNLRQSYPWALVLQTLGLPDGKTLFEADGVGVGATLGLTWEVAENQRQALTYRSPIKVALGLFSGRKIEDNMNPLFNGDYDFEAHLVSVSYGYHF